MPKRLYMPDGSYKEVYDEHEQAKKQGVDLTPREMAAAQGMINHFLQKYGGQNMKDAFPRLKREMEQAFEKMGLAVTVKPTAKADTADQMRRIADAKAQGYAPIEVEISHRLDWRTGDHDRELYEWQHRKEGKTAYPKSRTDKWL